MLAGLAVVLLLALPTLVPVAPAQASSDPWFGPSDRNNPTNGWAVRIPVVVQNPYDYTVTDPLVSVDVDFGKLLVEAGWTNQTVGADARLRGFTLDVDSIRVVEYRRGFSPGPAEGRDTKPTPHVFYESPFHADRYRAFDAARNPAGTVSFQIKDELAKEEKRYFYIYANPLEYTDTPAPTFKLEERAALDAVMWGSRGKVFYGYEPAQQGQSHLLQIYAPTDGRTRVEVFQYSLGQFVPVSETASYKNPFFLARGESSSFYVPGGTAFKVVADKPIVVAGHGKTEGANLAEDAWGFVPSRSGSFAGETFDLFGFKRTNAQASGPVTVMRAGTGTVHVEVGGQSVSLTSANPVQNIRIPSGQWSTLEAKGGSVLVSLGSEMVGNDRVFHTHQVPARSGGPSGTSFFTPLIGDGGFFKICPDAKATVRGVAMDNPTIQIYPEGRSETAPPAILEANERCTAAALSPATKPGMFEFFATKEDRHPVPDAPVPFKLFVGAGERTDLTLRRNPIGHFGGNAGVDYHVEGSVGIFGVYNDTRITIFQEHLTNGAYAWTNRTVAVSQDQFHQLPNGTGSDLTGRYRLVATKPISVVSTEPFDWPYARYVPGVPLSLKVDLGRAEFRGPLVEIRSPETDGRQLFRSTGPESPISFRLDVLNLGRWIGGENLPDDIVIDCTGPDGWDVEGCSREVRLNSGAAERLNVVITPPADDVNATRTIEVTARSKTGGMAATFKLVVYVEIRYGVGMWFDVEGGRKTIDPAVGIDPAETHTYDIVIKNTGSTVDTYDLRVEEARPGWTQALLHAGKLVDRITLEAGKSEVLKFRVTAPDAETAPQNIVIINAQSVTSALAADLVNTATRIRPKVDVRMTLEPPTRLAVPNETTAFNITVLNSGNDIFRVMFEEDSVLPEGWTSRLGYPEIDLPPNQNFTLQLFVTPPSDARAGDLATAKIAAAIDTGGGTLVPGDEVSAVVVVRRVHNITTPALLDAEVAPGDAFDYVLPLRNLGNGQDTVELLPGAVTPEWPVRTRTASLVIPYNESAEMPLEVQVPRGTPAGQYNLTLTMRLSREAFQNVSIPVQVSPLARVVFDGRDALRLAPANAVSLDMKAANTGNIEGDFTFATDAPEGWNVTFSPASAHLAPGEGLPVRVVINATRATADGAYDLELLARLDDEEAGRTPLPVEIARPLVYIDQVDAQGRLRAGELVLVSATIGNRGDITAENVTVALVADGKVVDSRVVNRIRVGQSAVATLSWVATGSPDNVRVVLDPEEEIVQATREETVATVTFGSRLFGVPAPSVPLVALAVVAAALAAAAPLRRWRG